MCVRYQLQNNYKVLFKIYVFLLALLALISFFGWSLDKNNDGSIVSQDLFPKTLPNKNRFWGTNITRTHFDGSQIKLSFKIESLARRQRSGRIFAFNNYDEIYCKGLKLDQLLKSKMLKFEMDEINALLLPQINQNESTYIDSHSVDFNLTEGNDGKSDNQFETETILGSLLNRLLIDDLTINFKPDDLNLKPIVVTANHAAVLVDTMTMKFEGHVNIQSTSCNIQSDIALWSNIENGFYFPNGYKIKKKTFVYPAFFQLTKSGHCNRVKLLKEIQYIDHLDQVEDKFFQLMPPSVQLMFGLIGTPVN